MGNSDGFLEPFRAVYPFYVNPREHQSLGFHSPNIFSSKHPGPTVQALEKVNTVGVSPVLVARTV